MIPRSIRWRLPLTYAAIALLTVIALGAVLVTTLHAHYSERELAYLDGNARVIGQGIARMLRNHAPSDFLQAQLENFSFLAQARIRLLDTDGQLVAESHVPGDILIALRYSRLPVPSSAEDEAGGVVFLQTPPDFTAALSTPLASDDGAQRAPFVPMMTVLDDRERWTHEFDPSAQPDYFYNIAVGGTPFGFGLNRDLALNGPRSDQKVTISLLSADDSPLGYVELSAGPAYGAEILRGVRQALAVAGLFAVVLAGGTGWYVSRRITSPLFVLTDATSRMADGQLSARVDVKGEDEFGHLGRSFNQMAAQVETTVSTLRRFVADAAHELHTPLTALHANLELAATEANDTQRVTFIERAVEQLKRLEALTGGLLDLSRIETHNDSFERAPIDLVTLVKETSELYASRAEQVGHCFYSDLPDRAVIALVNEPQIRRALGNLLDNAIKFTPAEGTIGVGLAEQNGCVELWVKDTGIGIPSEDLPLLFNRFHRGRNTAAYPGSGLGLAIIKAIVEGHHGQVSVKSSAQGTYFTLRLPGAGC